MIQNVQESCAWKGNQARKPEATCNFSCDDYLIYKNGLQFRFNRADVVTIQLPPSHGLVEQYIVFIITLIL